MTSNVYQIIKERILFLEYKPPQILNEKMLAEEFGVSRTPVREALKRLELEQLVRVLPRSGAMVTEIEFEKMMYTYQVRFKIEELVGDLAGEHMTPELIGGFEELKKQCLELMEVKNRRKLVDIDIRFRSMLFEAARNPILRMISDYLYNLTLRLWYITLDIGKWSEEVQAMYDEIDTTQKICRDEGGRGLGAKRQEILMWHLERIRDKYLGMSGPYTASREGS